MLKAAAPRTVSNSSLGCLFLAACPISAACHLCLGYWTAAADSTVQPAMLAAACVSVTRLSEASKATRIIMWIKMECVRNRWLLVNKAQGHLTALCQCSAAPLTRFSRQTWFTYRCPQGFISTWLYSQPRWHYFPQVCHQDPSLLFLCLL